MGFDVLNSLLRYGIIRDLKITIPAKHRIKFAKGVFNKKA